MNKIAPSLLAADFGHIREELVKVEQAGADLLHIDVMDGRFVPNISFGFPVMEAVRKYSNLPLDVHLMIAEPEKYINAFAEFKPEIITIHQEACPHLHRTIYQIKEKGIKAGVALNPGTSVETLVPVAEDLDMVLFMTVNPGFGGQSFIPNVLRKMEQGRALLRTYNKELLVEVDGGVNEETAKKCEYYGADILVAGSAIFGKEDYQQAINALR